MAPDVRRLRGRIEGSFAGRCVKAFLALQGLDRAMVIASQAFTALIPLLILVSAVLPNGDGTAVSDALTRRLGLEGEAAAEVQQVFAHSDAGTVGVGSIFLLLFSAVSLTRRLQRMYQEAWGLPRLERVRGSMTAALGLTAMVLEVVLLYLVRSFFRGLPFSPALVLPLSALTSVVLWTSIPWLLLDRRLTWRRLLPGGALVGVAVAVYGVATGVYMPPLMESYSDRYGLFGVTIALVGWLLCISLIIVAATVTAAQLDRAEEGWAVWLRARLGMAPNGTLVTHEPTHRYGTGDPPTG